MQTTSQRTQIILPRDLRDAIEEQRRLSGESLAEYLRVAAKERIKKEKKKKADLKKLAEEFVGSARGTMTEKEVEEWIQEIRDDRRLSDERLLKRWDDALKNLSCKHTK